MMAKIKQKWLMQRELTKGGVLVSFYLHVGSCVPSKKLPSIYKSCPKMVSLEKLNMLTTLQKLPKNVGDLGKLIVVTGFENLPKFQ